MKPSILLHTKFLVPRPTLDLLPRPHLVAWLEDQMDKRLILISAPAGYGKTTVLVDFLNASNHPFAWYQLDANDSDPTVFLTYLIEALRRMKDSPDSITDAVGRTAQSLLDSSDASISPQRVLTVLINELTEKIDRECLLVLEDYHYITNPVIHQLVDFLLENAPPDLRLLISTRSNPPISLARLRARGLLAELRSPSLRFREDEISTWMEQNLPGISSENLNLLNEKTEGWVAALQIMRSSLTGRDANSVNEMIAGLSGSQQFVFEYLAEEVFRRLPDEIREFLLRTSILSQMDAGACNAVAGMLESQATLQRLEKQNLFLSSLDPNRRWYRYHYLFRDFLYSRLQREDPEQLKSLERTAGFHYEEQSEFEAAYEHYLAGQDFESAARVILTFAADFVERGRVEILHRYLNALPAEVMHASPELLLQHGNAHWRLGQAGLAFTAFEDARSAFSAVGNSGGICRALTRLAEVNRAQGHYHQAQHLATEALSYALEDDHATRAEALMALAKSTGFLTGMDQGRSLAEQSMEEVRKANERLSPLARANYLQSLGQICWWHGDPQATVRYCQEALQLAPEGLSPIAAQAYVSMTTPYLYWRELDKALQFAERGLEIAQTLHLKELLPSAYTALGNVLTRLGETARAETCLRQAMEIGQQLGLASYEQMMATGFLAYNLCGQGRVDEARQLTEGVLWSYTGNPDTYEAYVCRSVLADVALESDQLDKAENLYTELVEVGERRQFRIPLAMVYFGLAYIYLVTERREGGLAYARKALHLIEASKVFQLFLDQGDRSRVVSQALIKDGEQSLFLERVLENLPAGLSAAHLSIVGEHTISVECLGTFRVRVGGEEISQERWVSTKARDLLAYFVTFRGERIPLERAFDASWGEKGSSRTAFHTALSRLRNALRTGDDAHRFIFVETGEYWLDPLRFRIDIDEFDAALAKARSATNTATAITWYKNAEDLCRGEYLQNLYYEWIFPERRRLTKAYLGVLKELVAYLANSPEPELALHYFEKAVPIENLNEELYCHALHAYGAMGDRAGLVRLFQELKQNLTTELDVDPSPSTTSQYQTLLKKLNA
jgi:ATP/maltotriose-dependent transcriptional regulator MalT/two-component SAPR family response regulator